jgi:hypothetical protein
MSAATVYRRTDAPIPFQQQLGDCDQPRPELRPVNLPKQQGDGPGNFFSLSLLMHPN